MTLIIGMKCADGVVMGADGAATLGSLGTQTICQPVNKLQVVRKTAILGVSGPVGLGQRFCGELTALWDGTKLSGKEPFEAMVLISDGFVKHMKSEYLKAEMAKSVIGTQAAFQGANSASLVAIPIKKQICLFTIDHQGSPEAATKDLPFSTIGSGQPIADPFLGFLRRVFWPGTSIPTLDEGILATLWTLQHAISIHPGGVAEPIQIVKLFERKPEVFAVEEVDLDTLQEDKQWIEETERGLGDRLRELSREDAEGTIPDVPEPS